MVYGQKFNLSAKGGGSLLRFCNNPADNNQECSCCSLRKTPVNAAWMKNNLVSVKIKCSLAIARKKLSAVKYTSPPYRGISGAKCH